MTEFTYRIRRTDGSWSDPLTYAQVIALAPERTEEEWQRYEGLEAIVGRAHAEVQP